MADENKSGPSSIEHERRSRLDRIKGKFRRKKDTVMTQGASPLAGHEKSFENEIQFSRTLQPETSARVLPESHNLQSATDEEPRSPHTKPSISSDAVTGKVGGNLEPAAEQKPRSLQNNQSDNSDGVTAEDEERSKDLWMHAYESLKLRDPDLVIAYERHLASGYISHTASAPPSLSPELIESIIKPKLDDRDAKRLVVRLGREPIKVREQGEKVIKFILWSSTFISTAISAQPFAALAWSGVSILLPLLLNSSTQSQAMIEGLSFISDLLRLYKYKERVYLQVLDKPAHPDFLKAIEELYADIFEYQARLICYLSGSWIRRGVRGTMQLDDWKPMLEKIRSSNDKCNEYRAISSEEKVIHLYANETSSIKQSIDIQNRVVDMLEASRAQRQEERRDDKEAELLEALASDYKSDKDSISARVPGTCEWFFEDERFLNWRNNKSTGLLWVSAGPGCGKSVLSRALIDERRVCSNAMTSTVCYFFFKDGQEHRTRGANALSAILHQLFENSNLISYALPSYKSYGKKLQDAFSELWGVSVKCAKDPEAGEIVCVLDALDECEEGARDQLIQKLVAFFSQKESYEKPPSTLKFLVTSRPYDNIEEQFEALSGVSTYLRFDGDEKSQKIGQEIDLVIDAKIPEIAGGFSNEDRSRISDRLKKMNNRTYLWLYLTIDIIKGSRSNYRKASSIDMLLSNLPSKVSDAYERILAKSANKVHARILLQIIVAATRPLTLIEANFALTVATQQGCTSHKALKLWPFHNFKSTVQNICGLFVSVYDEKLSLIHQTAREFLTRSSEPCGAYANEWQGCFDIATAHGTISKVCVDYLNFDEFATAGNLDQDDRDKEIYLLLKYTAPNWPVHYTSQPRRSAKDSRKAAQTLCNTSLPQITHWFPKHYLCVGNSLWKLTSLGIASYLGLLDVAEAFLNEGADVNAQYEHYGSALIAASLSYSDKVVQMLLENGADVNAQGGFYGNALQAASFSGYEKVVQILFENGANVNAQGGTYGNALQAASYRGNENVVQMLFENEADVNAQSGFHGNALQAASLSGYDKVVQMLLENGANVNAQSGHPGTALQAASSQGHDKVVQILLENKADVNAPGGYYGNALQTASLEGHEKIVQMLLENGVDLNAQGGYYGNALEAASYRGNENVVQMLLQHGADVSRKDIQGRTVLHLASGWGQKGCFEKLSRLVSDLSLVDKQERSCLHHAASGGSVELVTWLLQEGFDPNLADRDGWTPLHWAAKNGSNETVQVLLDAGAKSTKEAIQGWTPYLIAIFHNNSLSKSDVPIITHGFTESGLSSGQDIGSSTAAVESTNDACRFGPGFEWNGYVCDGCDLRIFGARYRCSKCPDFDYCFKCKASSNDTHDDHEFIMEAHDHDEE